MGIGEISVSEFAEHCRPLVERARAAHPEGSLLGREYGYASVPFCVIDSVFSLGVRYKQVENVVARFAEKSGWAPFSGPEHTVLEFLNLEAEERSNHDLFSNQGRVFQRADAPHKRDIVFDFAQVLCDHGVNDMTTAAEAANDAALDADLRLLPGQGQGTAVKYFFMLAGNEDLVKPDRMLTRFVNAYLGKTGRGLGESLEPNSIQDLFQTTAKSLGVTPRELDHLVWNHQRGT